MPAPVAQFTAVPLTGDLPLRVVFTDTSTNTPTSWLWDFGDGYTTTEQNPAHGYTTAGVYTVTLTASNSLGSDGETKTGYVTVTASAAAPVGQQITEISRLYLGRGLRGEPFGETGEQLELSVDLQDLGPELDQAMLAYQTARNRVWLPLTTSVGGTPQLVWEADGSLIPTQIAV